MPFYDMKCKNEECNYEEEIILNISEDLKDVDCPKCNSKMKTQISTGNFILSGFGWASKGNRDKPMYQKQIGMKVDHDLKNEMQAAGEKVWTF